MLENIKWGFRKKYENRSIGVKNNRIIKYHYKNEEYVIVLEEANCEYLISFVN